MRLFNTLLLAGILFMTNTTTKAAAPWSTEKGTYAVMETSLGTIVCRLFTDKSPKTTANFIGLSEGTKEWRDPKTKEMVKRPFYDGVIFHRVIPAFMIQGGCPLGNGYGNPGYKFDDEYPDVQFGKPGVLAMANSGPNTNGSQFFITVGDAAFLNNPPGHYSIFGQVVEGQNVANAISNVPRDVASGDRPLSPVTIKKISIQRNK